MLKSLHITLAYLTVIGFIVRGLWAIVDSPLREQKWVRVLPHMIDTALLGIGVIMVFSIGASFSDGWLVAKMLALLGFKPWESYGMTDDPIAAIARGGDEVIGRLGD